MTQVQTIPTYVSYSFSHLDKEYCYASSLLTCDKIIIMKTDTHINTNNDITRWQCLATKQLPLLLTRDQNDCFRDKPFDKTKLASLCLSQI